jgi:NAD(P)-dependent dehydrogenase (short-subunit alcohol dehydrogenase family)
MAGQLAGKVAVVTGAASGIGRASAELFVAEGAKVVVADWDAEKGEEVARGLGDDAVFIKSDVSSREDSQAMVDLAVSKFGKLDVMFNNAGISCKMVPSLLDDEFADFDAVMRVNVLGVMLGTRNAARVMKAQGHGGSIITTSSISGSLAGLGMLNYRSAKAAAIQFSKSAAIDLGQYEIRVNTILPGHVRTTMAAFQGGDEDETARKIAEGVDAAYLRNQPIKRRGAPIEVAEAALFLASDRSRYITGIVMPVDAGVTTGDPVNHLQEILDVQKAALSGA